MAAATVLAAMAVVAVATTAVVAMAMTTTMVATTAAVTQQLAVGTDSDNNQLKAAAKGGRQLRRRVLGACWGTEELGWNE